MLKTQTNQTAQSWAQDRNMCADHTCHTARSHVAEVPSARCTNNSAVCTSYAACRASSSRRSRFLIQLRCSQHRRDRRDRVSSKDTNVHETVIIAHRLELRNGFQAARRTTDVSWRGQVLSERTTQQTPRDAFSFVRFRLLK